MRQIKTEEIRSTEKKGPFLTLVTCPNASFRGDRRFEDEKTIELKLQSPQEAEIMLMQLRKAISY